MKKKGISRLFKPVEQKKVKGRKDGLCNRGICQSPDEVVFYNKGTRKYYCPNCADRINYANKDHPDTVRVIGEKWLCKTDDGLLPQEYHRKKFEEEIGELNGN